MKTADTIIHDEESALGYDQQAQATNWRGPEVVFGLAYELLRPGDTLSEQEQERQVVDVGQRRPGLD